MRRFIDKVMGQDLLSVEEEQILISEAKNGNEKSKEKIVVAYSKLVISQASKVASYNIDQDDLIQQGIMGIIEGIESFDATFNVRFSTHIIPLIKYKIFDYIAKNIRLVRITTTKPFKKLFFNLNSYKQKFNCVKSLTQDQIKQISEELNVPIEDVIEMEKRLYGSEFSLGSTQDDEESDFDIEDEFSCPIESLHQKQEQFLVESVIPEAINTLEDRQKDIILSRYCSDEQITLDELSKKYSVSKERIRQIEVSSLKKIKTIIEKGMYGTC